MKYLVLAIVMGSSLTACVPMPGDSIGGSRSAPAPMVPFTGAPSNTHPMLEDPEAQTETWSDEVWGETTEQAMQRCQEKAEAYTRNGGSLVTAIGVRRYGNTTKFECQLQSEVK